jgi:hypothetical protein
MKLFSLRRILAAALLAAPAVLLAQGGGAPIPPAPPPAPPPPAAFAAPCLFAPEDFAAVLGRTPEAGVAQRDDRGVNTCVYALPGKELRRVVVQVHERFSAERFDMRVATAGRIAAARPTLIADIGDGAFYVAGVAGTRRGLKYVEISGLRQAAARPLTADDAGTLLRLALQRLPRF